jgi:hypothetical protein
MTSKKMTVITSVTTIICDGPVYRLYKHPDNSLLFQKEKGAPIAFDQNISLEHETVKGVYINHLNGERILIGMTEEVYNKLSMPVDAFNIMTGKIQNYELLITQKQNVINKYKNAKFWQRYLYLLTGKLITKLDIKQVIKKVFLK